MYTAGRHADLEHNLLRRRRGARRRGRARRRPDVSRARASWSPIRSSSCADSKAVRPYVDALVDACVQTAAVVRPRRPRGPRAPRRRGSATTSSPRSAFGCRGRVTMHGLAFNVDPDLAPVPRRHRALRHRRRRRVLTGLAGRRHHAGPRSAGVSSPTSPKAWAGRCSRPAR